MEAEKQLMGLQYKIFKSQIQYLHGVQAKSLRINEPKACHGTSDAVLPPVPHDSIETQLLALLTENGSLRSASAGEALCSLISAQNFSSAHRCVVLEVLYRSRSSSFLAPFVLRGGLQEVMKWAASRNATSGAADAELLALVVQWFYQCVHCSLIGRKSQQSIRDWVASLPNKEERPTYLTDAIKSLLRALNQSLGPNPTSAAAAVSGGSSNLKKRPLASVDPAVGVAPSKKIAPSLSSSSPSLASIALQRKPNPSAAAPSSSDAVTSAKSVLDRYLGNTAITNSASSTSAPTLPATTTRHSTVKISPLASTPAASSPSSSVAVPRLPVPPVVALGRGPSLTSAKHTVSTEAPPPATSSSTSATSDTNTAVIDSGVYVADEEFGSFDTMQPATRTRRIMWADEKEGGLLTHVREFTSDPEERAGSAVLLMPDVPLDDNLSTGAGSALPAGHNYEALRKREHEGERIGFMRSHQKIEEERLAEALAAAKDVRATQQWTTPVLAQRSSLPATAAESKEQKLQQQRISRRPEVLYSSEADIPANPENPSELNPMFDMRSASSSAIIAIPFVNEDEVTVGDYGTTEEAAPNDMEMTTQEDEAESNFLEALPSYITQLDPEHLMQLVEALSSNEYMHLMMDPSQPAFLNLVESIAPGTKRKFNL